MKGFKSYQILIVSEKKIGRPKNDNPDTLTDKDLKPKRNRSPSKEVPKRNILNDSNGSSSKINDKKDKKKSPASNDQPKPRVPTDVASTSSASQNNSQHSQKPSLEKRSHITYKPFNKLFEGVEIVISGYQNPGRANVRDRALEMGAKYSGDWRSSSTHLMYVSDMH